MNSIDPTTGEPLPLESIQRVLFISRSVFVYQIPPLTSNKGYIAASWTADNNRRQIFTARLRILETAIPFPSAPSGEKLRFDILLEDPSNGQLFAAAPYTQPEAVQQAIDSSRFFAVRVQGDGGQKATLGIGFEERNEAFDFSVTLQEVRRLLDFRDIGNFPEKKRPGKIINDAKQDFSLKEGEMVVVDLGKRDRRKIERIKMNESENDSFHHPQRSPAERENAGPFLPPPPSAEEVKKRKRLSATFEPPNPKEQNPEELGFDNGEFGEFQ
ncbi:NECAP-like protein [Golovinomyces cichoracearum]|uniref:NECAP-like protein n=1 Tax=Golovinomyces cichoracearum TaxID=62708 RepID=A0A420JB56_9PEZI|nr:NECAP-like protein [Golovinomyces cichoracearum]